MRHAIALAAVLLSAAPARAEMLDRRPPTFTQQLAGTTSATVGTFTVALAQSGGERTSCRIVNVGSASMAVYFRHPGTTASIAAAIPLPVGGTVACADSEQDEVDVAGSAASVAYVVLFN